MKPKTDICLLLEGTYPYVTGGVSSWVHQLISSLQEFTFSLVIILPNKEFQQELKYPVPHNVQEIKRVYLHDYLLPKGTSGKLEKGLQVYADESALLIRLRLASKTTTDLDRVPYLIDAVCLDLQGIVYQLTGFFIERDIEIAEL
ncbi:DUF3492 domain-containing protein, partial [candidate division KSB1 bacterium]|nr:DUF3492 domain-containing protein [candidate division KSB1 bacterium]